MPAPTFVFFGDSLSDDGNLFEIGEGLIADEAREAVVGPTGAVSDGPTLASYAGAALGGDAENYAIASAEAVGVQTLRDAIEGSTLEDELLVPLSDPALDFDINIGAQVDRFLADQGAADLSETTAFLLIGGNDYQRLGSNPIDIITGIGDLRDEVVAATLGAATELTEAGVGQVTILTLPSPIYFPSFEDFGTAEGNIAINVFAEHNALLEQGAAGLDGVEVLDIVPITSAIATAPDAYGFIAPYGDTITGADALDDFDDEQVAFFDDIHPSTANHGIVGAYIAAVTEGAEVFEGGTESDDVEGGEGVDIMLGNAGDDHLRGRQGDDIVNGHDGNDIVRGGQGADLLTGGAGDDIAVGAVGDDVLAGNDGFDRLFGRGGNDVIVDGLGSDLARGGDGNDAFVHVEASLLGGAAGDMDRLFGGDGEDTLYVVLSEESFDALTPTTRLTDLGIRTNSIENVVFLDGLGALDEVENAPWSEDADLWGLI